LLANGGGLVHFQAAGVLVLVVAGGSMSHGKGEGVSRVRGIVVNRNQSACLSSLLGLVGLALVYSPFTFGAIVAGIAAIPLGIYGLKSDMPGTGILGIVCGTLVLLFGAVGMLIPLLWLKA
jgi:hypothetical protein